METKKAINEIVRTCHRVAVEHGFWEHDRNDGECIALMHSELSEVLEGLRDGNPPSKKIPDYSQAEEELADCIIRIFDFAGGRDFDIGGAIISKIEYNTGRPYKHGREF